MQSMTQSAQVFVEAETGRSRRHWIQVAPPPVVQQRLDEAPPRMADIAGSADAAREAAVKAAGLADAAQQIRDKAAELASRLESLAPDQPMPDWMREQLQQLRDDIERFTGRSQSLEKLLRELIHARQGRLSKDARLLKSLTDLADELRATKLSGVQGQPIPSKAQAGKEARDAEKAAAEDLRNIKGGVANLDQLLGGVTALTGPVLPPALAVPDAVGTGESPIGQGSQIDLSPAVLRVVPPQYRELVARYFDRLAKDGERQGP
jgi:predicted flap endonuclease-1-like 5' DNA nuclease